MTTFTVFALASLANACGAGVVPPVAARAESDQPGESSGAPSPSQRAHPISDETAPAPARSPSSYSEDAATSAIAAYRAALMAFNRRDFDAYFSAFADRLECFYGRAGTPLSVIRAARANQNARDFGAEDGGLAVWMVQSTANSSLGDGGCVRRHGALLGLRDRGFGTSREGDCDAR